MRYLLTFILLLCLSLRGATGDITGAEVESNGWVLKVWIEGMGTNYTFNFGLGTNNSLTGNETVKLSLTQPGFDDTGTSNNVPTVIVGTKQLRMPAVTGTQNDTMADVTTNDGVGCIIRLALSEYVFAGDGAITGTFIAGFYSDGVATNLAASITVTNSSTQTHPKAIANWSWPGWNRITNDTMTLRAVGFHRSAREGRPLRAMKFEATDGNTTQTVWRTAMQIDYSVADSVPVQEYIATIDVSGFTNGNRLRCDFTAYPWVGDSGAVLTTTDGVNGGFTPLYAPQTNFLDRLLAWGTVWAIVSTNGTDATGAAGLGAVDPSTNAFLTINGAAHAIAGSNSAWYGHADIAGSTIYVMEGTHQWTGASVSVSNAVTNAWCEVTRYPTAAVENVIIATQSGGKKLAGMTKFKEITFNISSVPTSGAIDLESALWVDKCNIDMGSTNVWFYRNTVNYFTRNSITNIGVGGLRSFSTVNASTALVRGNNIGNLYGSGNTIQGFTVLGNVKTTTNQLTAALITVSHSGGLLMPQMQGCIVAYNKLTMRLGAAAGGNFFSAATNDCTHGLALVGNLFESLTNSSTKLWDISSDSATNKCTNIIVWNNTVIGQRVNMWYNESGADACTKTLWSIKGNVFDDVHIKSDKWSSSTNENRIGNWSGLWSVGCSGNFWGVAGNSGGSTANKHEDSDNNGFAGLNSMERVPALSTNYQDFINHQAWDGTTSRVGNGDYRIQSRSPLLTQSIICDWLIRYDLAGNYRSKLDPTGAYNSATPRKGAAFGF